MIKIHVAFYYLMLILATGQCALLSGTVSWIVIPNTNTVRLIYRSAWERGSGPCEHACSQADVGKNGNVLNSSLSKLKWVSIFGNTSHIIHDVNYVMTSVSIRNTSAWEQGENNIKITGPPNTSVIVGLDFAVHKFINRCESETLKKCCLVLEIAHTSAYGRPILFYQIVHLDDFDIRHTHLTKMKRTYLSVALLLTLLLVHNHAQRSTKGDHQVCMLVPQATQDCFESFVGKPIKDFSAKISCLQDLLWNVVPDNTLDNKDLSFLRNLSSTMPVVPGQSAMADAFSGTAARVQDAPEWSSEFLYPVSGYRVRKEYRTLSDEERDRFHAALQRLYQDGFIETFAKIHARAGGIHHGGASFLPWHRILLIMFEEALRLYDISVSLPYWNSVFDDDMENPVNSVLWTDKYLGNGEGFVNSGPAAFWVTAQGRLERNFGKSSTLFKREHIQLVLSQCRMANISRPTAERLFDFEGYHGGPHVWVGGDMSAFSTTGYDPIFYMHHAFVDYIWEKFRERQRVICRNDPGKDYPNVPSGDSNHLDANMTGFDWFTNRDGISPHWTDNWYRYEEEPSCPDCCPGCTHPAPLVCDRTKYLCVGRSTLIDENGQLDRSAAVSTQAMMGEISGTTPTPPRNRGKLFDGPPSDGRTLFTAVQDAMAAAEPPAGK